MSVIVIVDQCVSVGTLTAPSLPRIATCYLLFCEITSAIRVLTLLSGPVAAFLSWLLLKSVATSPKLLVG